MQKPTYFEHQIVQPRNLDFLNESIETTVTDFITTMTVGEPGIASGFIISEGGFGFGNNFFSVSQGWGYVGNGERVELFSGTQAPIAFTGTKDVFIRLQNTVYDPNFNENTGGASNVVTNINPDDSSNVPVENYNFGEITVDSGIGYIPIGTVTADAGMLMTGFSSSGSQNLQIAGFIDLNTRTMSGANLGSGSIDSNLFSKPLHYDVSFDTGISINFSGLGSNIASFAIPLSNIYSSTGTFHEINGFSPILMDAIRQKAGASLEATGTNLVQIDTDNRGTQFGDGVTISGDAISTIGQDTDLNISAAALKTVRISSPTDFEAGDVTIKDNLVVEGTTTFPTLVASTLLGDTFIEGDLSYQSTKQTLHNILPNSNFGIPSGSNYVAITGDGVAPASWDIDVPNQNFSFSPNTSDRYFLWPTAVKADTATYGQAGDYTIEASVFFDGSENLGGSSHQALWSEDANNRIEFKETTAAPASTMKMYFVNNHGGGAPAETADDVIGTGQWYHVAFTWSGTSHALPQRQIYIDGEEMLLTGSVTDDAGLSPSPTNERIGTHDGFASILNGKIDNFRISNVARTTFPSGWTDIKTDSDTVALWKFDNPENFAEDSSEVPGDRNLDVAALSSLPLLDFFENGFGQIVSGTTQPLSTDTSGTNALFGTPKTTNWLQISGSNIDATGIHISTSIPEAKTDTDYKASFHYKPINFVDVDDIDFGISISGLNNGVPVGSSVNTLGLVTIAGDEWARYDFDFHTPASGTGLTFEINPYYKNATPVNPTMSGTGIFGLTSVQLTEGDAVVPYSPKLVGPEIIYSKRTNAIVHQTTIVADTFPLGGEFNITNKSPLVSVKVSIPLRTLVLSFGYVILKVDGNIVETSGPWFSPAIWGGYSTGYAVEPHISWDGYLEKGSHTLEVVVASYGWSGGNPNCVYGGNANPNFTAGSSPSSFTNDAWIRVIQH